MSAHASLATSGCQSLSLVGESVNHHASTTPKRRATAAILRHSGLTNASMIANATARSPAATLFAFPNGASNHTAPNAQVIAIMAVTRMSTAPAPRITRTRSFIIDITTQARSKKDGRNKEKPSNRAPTNYEYGPHSFQSLSKTAIESCRQLQAKDRNLDVALTLTRLTSPD